MTTNASQQAVSSELREGILQDIVAMSMITTALERRLDPHEQDGTVRMLRLLSEKLSEDAERLRSVIAELEAA
jgi:hypothetical protein